MADSFTINTRWEEENSAAVCVGEAKTPTGEMATTVRIRVDWPLSKVREDDHEDLREKMEEFVQGAAADWGVRAAAARAVGERRRVTWEGTGGLYTMTGMLSEDPAKGYLLEAEEGGQHRFGPSQIRDIDLPEDPPLQATAD
jgi:hypothetical protein